MGDFSFQLDHNLTANERGNVGPWSLVARAIHTYIARYEHAESKASLDLCSSISTCF